MVFGAPLSRGARPGEEPKLMKPTPPSPARPPSSARDTRHGVLIMVLSVICFTTNTLLLKSLEAFPGADYTLALFIRAIVGIVIVFTFFTSRRPLEVGAAILHPRLVLRGFLGIGATAALYYTINDLGAGKATLIGTAYVLFGALIAAVFLRERMSAAKARWLVLAFGGIALLTGAGHAGGSFFGLGSGEIIALGGAVTAGWVVVLIRQLTLRYSNATIYFSQCFWIAVSILPFALMRSHWPGWGGFAILVLAGAAGGFGQIAMVQSYRYLEVAKGASIQMALPVAASLGGFLLFGEIFTPLQVAGAALTILGSWRVVAENRIL